MYSESHVCFMGVSARRVQLHKDSLHSQQREHGLDSVDGDIELEPISTIKHTSSYMELWRRKANSRPGYGSDLDAHDTFRCIWVYKLQLRSIRHRNGSVVH